MEKYLLQVNIGPVQGFIASARRTRDLWFGSALLSRLAMEAAIAIEKASGRESLIFPSPRLIKDAGQNKNISVPNKILAVVDARDETAITQLGKEIYAAIWERLENIHDAVHKRIDERFQKGGYERVDALEVHRNMARLQIEQLIEYRWVALPYQEGKYASQREQLELLMAARKNMYDFKPVSWGNFQPKSSIDGQLECVIPQDYYARRFDDDRFKKQALLFNCFQAGPSERLSGVDLLKRLGELTDESSSVTSFPSTSHIATIPYLERLSKLDSGATSILRAKWGKYIKALEDLKPRDGGNTYYIKDLREQVIERVKGYSPAKKNICPHPIFDYYDGSMLFHEHFLDIVTEKKFLDDSAGALQNFFTAVRDELDEKLQPQPYYAILQADGDGMGKVIDAQAKYGVKGHQDLSRQIDKFAEEARDIIRDHLGATVYAGGDDVLALVPIHKVLRCAAKLSEQFKTLLDDFKDEGGNKPSLSVGIAIVHHLELLSEALKVARRAEKKAKGYQKKRDGRWVKKDALAIIVSKRSGEEYDIAGRWGDLNSFLEQLTGYYRDEVIPKGTAYELRESALRLRAKDLRLDAEENTHETTHEQEDAEQKKKQRDVLLAEAERILQRKLLVGQGKSSKREQAKQVLALLERRLGISGELATENGDRELEMTSSEEKPVDVTSTIEEFVHELVIAEMLADAERLAGTEKREGQK